MLDKKTGLRRRVKRSQGEAGPPVSANLGDNRNDMVQGRQWEDVLHEARTSQKS